MKTSSAYLLYRRLSDGGLRVVQFEPKDNGALVTYMTYASDRRLTESTPKDFFSREARKVYRDLVTDNYKVFYGRVEDLFQALASE